MIRRVMVWSSVVLVVVGGLSALGLLGAQAVMAAALLLNERRMDDQAGMEIGAAEIASWTFVGGDVTIGSAGRPIPQDVFGDALATHPAPKAIEARWTLDASAGILRLSEVIIDGVAFTDVLEVPIRPAGQVRVTLGERQYNLVRAESRGSGSSDPRRDP